MDTPLPPPVSLVHTGLATAYVIKTKGVARIPDYVQVRDANYTLLAYFRADRPEKGIHTLGLAPREAEVANFITDMVYGKVIPFPFEVGEPDEPMPRLGSIPTGLTQP